MKINLSKTKFLYSSSLLILLWIVFTACQSEPAPNIPGTATQGVPVVSAETTPPTTTNELIVVTVTRQPSETLVSPKVTPIPSPIPTLSLAEKKAITSELYKTNANCKLPCWWGIIPGKTEWQTAKLFLGTLATEISTGTYSESDPEFVVQVYLPVTEKLSEINLLTQSYSVNDGIIEIIHPERPRGASKIYTISDILNAYGHPTEVWLDTLGVSFSDYFPFEVVLFYPEKGILVRYFDDAEFPDNYLTGCPQNRSGKFTLWSPELELTFVEALSGTNALGTYGGQYYKPLEEATEMDLETFYQTFLDPDTETCIETPAELWMDR